jgi:tetratricopeptide (TPR) repeat protein
MTDMAIELRRLVDAGRADEVVRRSEQLTDAQLREAPDVEIEVARALARAGQFQKAMARATTALWGFRVQRDLRGQMRANLVLGGLAFEQGHPYAAEHHFGLVRVLAVSLGDQQVQSQVTNNLACLALQKGDFHAAEHLLQSSLDLARDLANLRAQAEAFHNLNAVYRGLGRFEAATEAGSQAVSLGEKLEDWSMVALALGGLAETTAWLDNTNGNSDGLLDRADASARRAGDPVRQAEVGRVRAVVALRRREFEAARRVAEEARQLAAKHDAELLAAECTAIMAVASKREGRAQDASTLREEATVALYRLRAYLETEWFEREWSASAA